VTQPVVVGFLKPAVLVPAGFFMQIPPGEIEAVIFHELAHIRRHDFLLNLIQIFIEAIFFFNPAIIWLSSQIRKEREYCCDEIAVARTGNKKVFVQALVSVHELYPHREGRFVAFAGSNSLFFERTQRILYSPKEINAGRKVLVMIFSFFLFAMIIFLSKATIKPSENQVAHDGFKKEKLPDSLVKKVSPIVDKSLAKTKKAFDGLFIHQPEGSAVRAKSRKKFVEQSVPGDVNDQRGNHDANKGPAPTEPVALQQGSERLMNSKEISTTIADEAGRITNVTSIAADKKKIEEDLINAQKKAKSREE
jgi:hypothetical protein